MREVAIMCFGVLTAIFAWLVVAAAQTGGPTAAARLLAIHGKAGVTCAACHAERPPKLAPAQTTCLHCHGGNYAAVAAKSTAVPNPHASHLGELPCGDCHHVHRASVIKCNQCHSFDLSTP